MENIPEDVLLEKIYKEIVGAKQGLLVQVRDVNCLISDVVKLAGTITDEAIRMANLKELHALSGDLFKIVTQHTAQLTDLPNTISEVDKDKQMLYLAYYTSVTEYAQSVLDINTALEVVYNNLMKGNFDGK